MSGVFTSLGMVHCESASRKWFPLNVPMKRVDVKIQNIAAGCLSTHLVIVLSDGSVLVAGLVSKGEDGEPVCECL